MRLEMSVSSRFETARFVHRIDLGTIDIGAMRTIAELEFLDALDRFIREDDARVRAMKANREGLQAIDG